MTEEEIHREFQRIALEETEAARKRVFERIF